MATTGEEEVEYDSDPEEAKRALAMRRREAASDDEDGEEREEVKAGSDRRVRIHSDESDDQGGVAEYDDEEEYIEEYDEELEDDEGYDDDDGFDEDEIEGEVGEEGKAEERNVVREGNNGKGVGVEVAVAVKESDDYRGDAELHEEVEGDAQLEEKKENEPFSVPTAGAFYMHDDRFRDNAGGRPRRFHGGRKLWESKDDRKWGHDKFEEMNMQERRYDERLRTSRGRYQGRGRGRGTGRGYGRENRSKTYNNNNSNQNQAPKGVRGRGPRRYELSGSYSNQTPSNQNKQSVRPTEKNPQTGSGRASTLATNVNSDPAPARKQGFASSLSSASPPFYPSATTNRDIGLTQKKDLQTANNRNFRHNMTLPQNNTSFRGKNVIDNVSMEKLYIDDSISHAPGKPVANFPTHPSGSSMSSSTQSSQSHVQGKGVISTGKVGYVPSQLQNQGNRGPVSSSTHAAQRNHAPNRVQPSVQQLGQHPSSGSQASSPPNSTLSVNSVEPGEPDSGPESNKSKGALVGKTKSNVESGRGSFFFGGNQVMGAGGNMGVGQGDQNFPAPTFLPVMQFGGQHPGGMGVPAVGMAFPGYVAQPHGMGSSEMTWLPVLAGAAGALGATYCPPYLAVDGAYQARPGGQTSSMGPSSKDTNTNKPDNEWKPSQRPETVTDESGQRQNKPRRYSEMNFAP